MVPFIIRFAQRALTVLASVNVFFTSAHVHLAILLILNLALLPCGTINFILTFKVFRTLNRTLKVY